MSLVEGEEHNVLRRRHASTWIELLVVIAIIALLMALLMPALQRVKKQARSVACLSRHDGFVNGLFLDFSNRKIGRKERWTFKWHRRFDTSGPWTTAGGCQPADWPEWMRNFQDY